MRAIASGLEDEDAAVEDGWGCCAAAGDAARIPVTNSAINRIVALTPTMTLWPRDVNM